MSSGSQLCRHPETDAEARYFVSRKEWQRILRQRLTAAVAKRPNASVAWLQAECHASESDVRQALREISNNPIKPSGSRASGFATEAKSMEQTKLTATQIADAYKWLIANSLRPDACKYERRFARQLQVRPEWLSGCKAKHYRHNKGYLDANGHLYIRQGKRGQVRTYIIDCEARVWGDYINFTFIYGAFNQKASQPTEDKSMERNEMQKIEKLDAEYQKARLNRDKALQDWQANRISDNQLQQAEDSLSRAYAARRLAWLKVDPDNLLQHKEILRAHGRYSTAMFEHREALHKDKQDNGFRHGATAVTVEECYRKLCKALREIPLEQRDAYFTYVVTADGRQAFLTIEQAMSSLTQWANLMGLKRIGDGKVAGYGQISLHAAPAIY